MFLGLAFEDGQTHQNKEKHKTEKKIPAAILHSLNKNDLEKNNKEITEMWGK